MTGTSLYRAYDAGGALLYVGISLSWAKRLKDHEVQEWLHQVSTVTLEHFSNRDDAQLAERSAIKSERPIHNVIYNRPAPRRTVSEAAVKRKAREQEAWFVDNAGVYLHSLINGRVTLEDLPNWFRPAHYILAYPERLKRFTQLWREGAIPDGWMSNAQIAEEMNIVKGPRIKSVASYSNWKAKGFPGFNKPKKEE